MSVINQMLRDLEERHAPVQERGPLGGAVRPLPEAESARVPLWLVSAAAALVVGTLAGFGAQRWLSAGGTADTRVGPTQPAASGRADAPDAPKPPAAGPVAVVSEPAVPAHPAPVTDDPSPAAVASVATISANVGPAIEAPAQQAGRPASTPARADRPAKRGETAKGARDRKAPATAADALPSARTVATEPAAAAASTQSAAPVASAQRVPGLAPATHAGGVEVRTDAAQRSENDYRRALHAIGQGRTAEAQELLGHVLAAVPEHDGARHALLGLLVQERRLAAAETLADERLARDPKHPGFAQISARLKLDRGEVAAALDVLTRTLPQSPENAELLAFRAAVLQRLGRHGESVADYGAALRLRPQSAVWQMGLAISLQAMARNEDALTAFRSARSSGGLSPELQAFVEQRVRQLERP